MCVIFRDAVGSLDGVHCSSINVTLELKSLAVLGFGDPSSWTEVQVSELGNVIGEMNPLPLRSLQNKSVLEKSYKLGQVCSHLAPLCRTFPTKH